eukprot:TRINITY_DN20660_c0_g1_i1.p1 TRINITY_DN20660_c0_g1~~TRINITY_DN20660_c0_g1_i1.p1  ORF type:complete len:169 (-),score=21.81 TRINITY_DN20660_c0_g1_i1:195-701(-)
MGRPCCPDCSTSAETSLREDPVVYMLQERGLSAYDDAALEVPDGSEHGTRTTFTVSDRQDLWRVVQQGPHAIVEIPELEFAIKPGRKRRIDTIYNMIAAAVFHLSNHIREGVGMGNMNEADTLKVCEAISCLNAALDLEDSFTLVIADPEGVSSVKPSEGVHVGAYMD